MLNLAVMLPIVAGALLLALRPRRRGLREGLTLGATLVTSLIVLLALLRPSAEQEVLLALLPEALTKGFHLLNNRFSVTKERDFTERFCLVFQA